MATKYYVVWKGRETGIFTTWAQCQAQVDKFAGARFKSFPTLAEAEAAFGGKASARTSRSTGKGFKSTASKVAKKPKAAPLSQQQITEMLFDIKIFTDGACEPNPGEAGTGLAIYQDNQLSELWYGLYQGMGTNNTAELNGLYQAFLIAQQKSEQGLSVAIYCDSMYSIQCITQWAAGWEKKGWVKQGGEIKNLELIQKMYALYKQIKSKMTIYHVNGHVGIEGNELADRMSIIAIESQEAALSLYRESSNIEEILASRRG
ncbi:ribonuclease H1 domain-containing protein [Vibrio scophthalmi]|uniref:ribonuclease H n=1 Tax=Vibrio scophthalmi TaxID=45658 RepID=A0A1E3WN25_9VIBR|nr:MULTISPECIES: ribonuclease H family protein [Vibrio]EGU33798.1 ribonuclease H [Vibrio sp. N418]MCY9803810.1 ribonuclease H family protein [Vibrio scophthalmi]ODS11156.1 Ribonuclease H [Vibrio scophthalmi]